ncbi:MAG: nickel-dependent lactate racemase, partial [Spirochaetales bacterium]|nr:nickel-dependent lactate racemase [Spirochaetales bacterium]
CDVKILTGFIEPHFFAGFSGGGKAVMPGMAALSTIMRNHGYENLSHENARWGVTTGNPVWEDVTEAAETAGSLFLLNVTMNRDKQITGVFAGDLRQAHGLGVHQAREESMAQVSRLYDLVITSNAGYPLDLNLYQTVKGLSAAAQVVKPGGHILAAADCWDGIPDHGEFGRLLSSSDSPEELLDTCRSADPPIRDAWQAMILCQICKKAHIHLYSENLTDRQIESAFMTAVKDMAGHVAHLIRSTGEKDFTVCVLPQGPLTIPFYNSEIC